MSSIVNKIKDAVTPSSHSEPEGTRGPHETRAANAADPRVDSDNDRHHGIGSTTGHTTTGHTTGTSTGTGLTSGNHGLTGSSNTTAGPHSSDMANRLDPRVDSDRDNSTTLGGDARTGHNVPEGVHGPHGSRAANALDPRVDSDHDRTIGPGSSAAHSSAFGAATGAGAGTHFTSGTGATGTSEGLHGPHGSRAANALDPRVDSDRDGSRTAGNTTGTHGLTGTTGTTGTHGLTGNTTGTHGLTGNTTGTHGLTGTTGTHSEGVHGPHGSRAANALDPRVDSDRDGSRTAGNTTGTHGTGIGSTGVGYGAATGHGTTGTHGTTGLTGTHGTAEGARGPHDSRVANALDPRVDSDRDGSKTVGNTSGPGYGTAQGTHGPHDSRAANTLDPRVDSDRDGRAKHAGGNATSTGDHVTGHAAAAVGGPESTGPAPNTAGPHKSDILNKLDPRVDSDLDGSKTVGGDKTFAQS